MFTVSVLLTIFFKVCGYTFVTNFFTFQKKNTFGVSAFHLYSVEITLKYVFSVYCNIAL